MKVPEEILPQLNKRRNELGDDHAGMIARQKDEDVNNPTPQFARLDFTKGFDAAVQVLAEMDVVGWDHISFENIKLLMAQNVALKALNEDLERHKQVRVAYDRQFTDGIFLSNKDYDSVVDDRKKLAELKKATACSQHSEHDRDCFACVKYALYDTREKLWTTQGELEALKEEKETLLRLVDNDTKFQSKLQDEIESLKKQSR